MAVAEWLLGRDRVFAARVAMILLGRNQNTVDAQRAGASPGGPESDVNCLRRDMTKSTDWPGESK